MTPETHRTSDEHELDDVALEALAEAYAQPAPPQLRTRLLAAVANDRAGERAVRSVRRARMIGTLAAGLALVCGALFARELQANRARAAELAALTEQNGLLAARLDEQGRTLAGLRDALDAQGQILRLVGGPRILTATLAPKDGSGAAGRVLVDSTTGDAAIVLSGLAPAAEGKTYELWAIRGNRPPEPAGLVNVNAQRSVATSLPGFDAPKEVTAFAVSLEPRGGSKSPTGPIVLVGAVTS